jgi:general secretion pathway protein M
MSLLNALQPLNARWARVAPREKKLVLLAAGLLLAALLWLLILAPALATLRSADAQARTLNAQLQHMQLLQAQAQALQKQAPLGFDDALRALTSATRQSLGATAQLNVMGDRASVTLKGASADALAEWLTQARVNARSVPLEARLVRATTPGAATWNGVLVMGLPQR